MKNGDLKMTTTDQQESAGVLASQEALSFSGITAEVLLGGKDAPFTVMRMVVSTDQGSPRHRSIMEDKIFHIISGRLKFLCGEETTEVGRGEVVHVPRDTEHSFRAMGEDAVMLLVSNPARHDRFFKDMSALCTPHDQADVIAVCERHGQAITGGVIDLERQA
jgi:quercetin dioxygenase-like cupin family protein